MVNVTSENIFINAKLSEINDIMKNTRLEYDQQYGEHYCREIEVRCNFKFFDEIKNKTKNFTIKHYHLHGINKTIVASQGRYELFKPNKLIILVQGIISKNVINTYMKFNNFPTLWIIFFIKNAKNSDYVYNFVIDRLMIFIDIAVNGI